jgi:hypothetical protein
MMSNTICLIVAILFVIVLPGAVICWLKYELKHAPEFPYEDEAW